MEYSWWKLLGETELSKKEFKKGFIEAFLFKRVGSHYGVQKSKEKREKLKKCFGQSPSQKHVWYNTGVRGIDSPAMDKTVETSKFATKDANLANSLELQLAD